MIVAICNKLKTGTYQNVLPYGSDADSVPYVIVKQESHPRGTGFRVIAHFEKGQQTFLEDYIRGEVGTLLEQQEFTSRNGSVNVLDMDDFEGLPNLIVSNDDKTISMERLFYMPDKWFP